MGRAICLRLLVILFVFFSTTACSFTAENITQEVNNTAMKDSTDSSSLRESEQIAWEIFQGIWADLSSKLSEKKVSLPRQIVFLNGAPGAGKGTNTLAVMRELEIPTKPIEVSALLNTPECERLKSQGLLVPDDIVIEQTLKELFKPENRRGVIIDGYPRTIVQAYFLKFFINKVQESEYTNKTAFRLINFSVSRETSISRQLSRGRAALEHNKISKEKLVVRKTDLSREAAERRYDIYESSISRCIALLRDDLEYYEIRAEGTFDEVRKRIHEVLDAKNEERIGPSSLHD